MIFAAFEFVDSGTVAVPQEGAEHHLVFEALGLVDSDDLHQVAVRFEAQLRHLVGAIVATPGGQPAQQRIRGRIFSTGLLQQFAEMEQVGQPPFAVAACEQAAGDRFVVHPLPEHDAKAPAQPGVAVAAEARHGLQQPCFVVGQRGDGGGIEAHQLGSQRAIQQRLAGRLDDRQQDVFQTRGVRRVENAVLRQLDAADTDL